MESVTQIFSENYSKKQFMEKTAKDIAGSEKNLYAKNKRQEMFNEYRIGMGENASWPVIKELRVASLEENETPNLDLDVLYHRLVTTLYQVIGNKAEAASHEMSQVYSGGYEKIENIWSNLAGSIKTNEWRSGLSKAPFEERVAISEAAMISDVRYRKAIADGSHKIEDYQLVDSAREKLIEFHLRTNGVGVDEVPPLSGEAHFTAFEIFLSRHEQSLIKAGKINDFPGIMGTFSSMEKMRESCKGINTSQEAVDILSSDGGRQWGFGISQALETGKGENVKEMFKVVGEMEILGRTFDEVRSKKESTSEQIKTASASLFEVQKNCFNAMQRIDYHDNLQIN